MLDFELLDELRQLRVQFGIGCHTVGRIDLTFQRGDETFDTRPLVCLGRAEFGEFGAQRGEGLMKLLTTHGIHPVLHVGNRARRSGMPPHRVADSVPQSSPTGCPPGL